MEENDVGDVSAPGNESSLRADRSAMAVLEKGLSRHADPFTAREGKKLTWTAINMSVRKSQGRRTFSKDEIQEKSVLNDVWGEVPKKEITAIMGPSGAGKTSLLNILSGRSKTRGNIMINADIRLNNHRVDPTHMEVRKQIAFVAQEDSLQVTSTPREALRFSAKMRLPRETTEKELDILVEHLLHELGLEKCADIIIGGDLLKGISGGERKRTSVGVELVVKPALVFLDEPTSGLDSFSAVQLIQVLKKVANAGSSVLFTIHQPSSEVFNSFDHLILMNKGRVMYEGEVSDVPNFFEMRGNPLPKNYNPADWIMNVAQTIPENELEDSGFFPKDSRSMNETLHNECEGKRDALGIMITDKKEIRDEQHVSFMTEVSMQFRRELKNIVRNKTPILARYFITVFLSLLVGAIFFGVGGKDRADYVNFNAQFGALIVTLINSMFSTATPSLLAFPEERPVFLREYSTDHYSVVSYFISRLTTEIFVTLPQMLVAVIITYTLIDIQMPFFYLYSIVTTLAMGSTALAALLGCAVEDPKMATEFLPMLFVPQLLLSGFFVSPALIPALLSWAPYLCSLSYAIRLALMKEFGDCAKAGVSSCERVINDLKINEGDEWWYWLILVMLFVVFRLSALYLLKKKGSIFF